MKSSSIWNLHEKNQWLSAREDTDFHSFNHEAESLSAAAMNLLFA
jgi:hypothetical protein